MRQNTVKKAARRGKAVVASGASNVPADLSIWSGYSHGRDACARSIMTVALHLFVSRGYFNTTMRDIGSEANLSAGAIYYHFKSKEDIARSLFDDLVASMGRHFNDIEARYNTAHDRCRAVVELLFQIAEEEPEAMEYMLYTKHLEFLDAGIPVCSSKPFRQMRAMVQKGMKNGEVRLMDPTVAAAAVYGGPLRMISMRLDGIVGVELPTLLDEVWESAWRSVSM